MTVPSESRAAVAIARRVPPSLRLDLLHWAEQMAALSRSPAPAWTRARKALVLTHRSGIALAVTAQCARTMHEVVWKDRSWAARLGLSAAAIATLTSSQGAGIAALGGAVGVPLWIVVGAGGTFVGTLMDELKKLLTEEAPPTPEAEWELTDDEPHEILPADPAPLGSLRAAVKSLASARSVRESPASDP